SLITLLPQPPLPTLFPYTTLFRSHFIDDDLAHVEKQVEPPRPDRGIVHTQHDLVSPRHGRPPHMRPETPRACRLRHRTVAHRHRSEEHTSELQSLAYLVCRLLLEK